MNRMRLALGASVLCNVLLLCFLFYNRNIKLGNLQIKNSGNSNQSQGYWLNRDELFKVLPKSKNSIVFLGSSLTQNFELAEFFGRADLKNRGIFADSIAGVLGRLEPIVDTKPQKIFIEIGINDLASGHSHYRVFSNYKILLAKLKQQLNQTDIYIQSLLPTETYRSELVNYCNPKINKEIIYLNTKLKKMANEEGVTYIDLHSNFFDGKGLKSEYSVDGVHLSGEGYMVWAKGIKKYIEK